MTGVATAVDISVVIGIYNGREIIRPTLDSLFAQEDASFEIVVVDDGSTDGTADLLDRTAESDSRLRVIRQSHAGLTAALRRGCAAAEGIYIARQDAGDLSQPRRLVLQKKALDAAPDVVFASCWTQYVAPEGEELWIDRDAVAADEAVALIDLSREWGVIGGPTHHGSVMMRRADYEAAGGYREEFYFGQDWDLWFRLAERGRFQIVGSVLYTARIAPNSISTVSREPQMQLAQLSLAALRARAEGKDEQAILARAREIRPLAQLPKSSRAEGLYFIGEALRRRGNAAARRYLRDAIAARPWMLRAWLRWMQSAVLRHSERG
jgi:glycosyltransferase involved in cell wall biosynthesis